jgi:hypothetical protein
MTTLGNNDESRQRTKTQKGGEVGKRTANSPMVLQRSHEVGVELARLWVG